MTQNADYAGTPCDHLGRRWALGQCLMCGGDDTPADSGGHLHEWSDWTAGMVAEHRYCRCGEAESRPLSPLDPSVDCAECDHPFDAIHWNRWNRATQCHRCGHVFDRTPMPSDDAMHYSGGEDAR